MEQISFDQLLDGLVTQDYDVNLKITDQLEHLYPGQAFLALCKVLADPETEAALRVEVVRGLGRLKDKRAIPLMIEALADQDAEVRKEAARFLAPMRDDRAVEPLVALLSDARPDVRLAAITPLGRHLFDSRAAEGLLRFLASADEQQRPVVITALSKSEDEQVMGAAVERLNGQDLTDLYTYLDLVLRKDEFAPNPERKRALLAQLQKSGVLKSMLTALRADDPQVRTSTATLLAQLEAPLVSHALLISLKDESVHVRLNAVDALRKVRDAEAIEALFLALDDKDPRVAARSIDALASINDSEILPRLLLTLMKVSDEVLCRASQGLARLTHPMAVPTLVRMMNDSDAQTRSHAVYALARVDTDAGTFDVVGALLALLNDPAPEVRAQTAQALGESGDGRAVQPLRHALEDSDPLVIRAAVLALGQLGDVAALAWLLEILQLASQPYIDRIWLTLQESVIYALGQLGDPQAVPALLQLLEQHGQASHTLCLLIDSLERLGDPRASEPVGALRQHRNAAVRKRAEQVMAKWQQA